MQAVYDQARKSLTFSLTPQEDRVLQYYLSKYTTTGIEAFFSQFLSSRLIELQEDRKNIMLNHANDPDVIALFAAKGITL